MLPELTVPRDFCTKKELEAAAEYTATKASSPELQQVVYLYFLARYLVVIFETSFAGLPIQVWNEYRNALDHYIRHLTQQPADTTDHLRKLEGHVQRAVLDVSKLLCHKKYERLSTKISTESREALRLVDNGDFVTHLENQLERALKEFETAKMQDLSLGDDAKNNREILGQYLDAYYAIAEAEEYWASKREAIQKATTHMSALKATAAHQSSREHVRDSLVAKFIWTVAGFILFVAFDVATADDGYVATKLLKLSNMISFS